MLNLLSSAIPYMVLGSHLLFLFLLAAIIFRKSWGRDIARFLGSHAIALAFLVTASAVLGSLFYSEGVGFEPCSLCWWQRLLIYPLSIIFGMALWKKSNSAFLYAVPLAALAAIVAGYHSYVYLGGTSFLPCTALGGACSKIYVMAFGYITIPMMSLTIALYVLLLAWAHKLYRKNDNSNSR